MSNLTIGKTANNSVTLMLTSEQRSEVNRAELLNVSAGFVNTHVHSRFWVTVPNSMGFTHKTRCLCHVESVSGTVEIKDPAWQVSALGGPQPTGVVPCAAGASTQTSFRPPLAIPCEAVADWLPVIRVIPR